MLIPIDQDRLSDSPFVERVWRTHSEHMVPFTSIASSNWEMVVSRLQGQTTLTIRGPESRPTAWICPAGGEWLGIRFKPGAFMPLWSPGTLVDRGVTLPNAGRNSFWFNGAAWEFPRYENADTFVKHLVHDGLLVHDRVVDAAVRCDLGDVSPRTTRRHFIHATGLTPNASRQIERARFAAMLLHEGRSIADVVYEAGYFDQPHLTRALKRYIGDTPAQLAAGKGSAPLSYLYKTPRIEFATLSEEVYANANHNR
jgi:AraC-like DNA-binding protein